MSERHRDFPSALRLHPTAFIAPGAIVVGEVAVGARSSIWFNTVARGDSERIEIGDDTNVQDNSVVHVDEGMPAIVGNRVTIGHRAIVHGCVIEDDVLIGMGAVVLSGARIGAGSLIGASALVREGQVIPPGSLALGAPARVIGPVSPAHTLAIAVGAKHYAELSLAYLNRGIAAVMTSPGAHLPRAGEAMSWLEWEQRVDVLRNSPAWAAGQLTSAGAVIFARRREPGRWSAAEVLAHLRDVDRDMMLPRLEQVLAEEFPALPDVSLEPPGEVGESPAEALASWTEVRAEVVARLDALRPADWCRAFVHARLGPMTLGDLVRMWSDHDLSHRRQVRDALGVSS